MEIAFKGARWGALTGLALGLFYSVGGLILDLMTTGLNAGTALAFLALIGMPLIFGVIGFIAGLSVGWFNSRESAKPGH